MRLTHNDENKIREAIKKGGEQNVMLCCGLIVHITTTKSENEQAQCVVELTRSRNKRKVGTFTGSIGKCYAETAEAIEEFETRHA